MDIYQHFRKDEKEFIDRIVDAIEQVKSHYAPKLLDFLDPRQQQIVSSLVGTQGEVSAHFFGGHQLAERKRVMLSPDYYHPVNDDFELALFEVRYASKFTTLEHRHVLGTMMSLGLKREKFGDIWINGEQIQVVLANEISSFMQNNVSKMGKAGVKFIPIAANEASVVSENWEEVQVTVSAMRLDAVLTALTGLAREKSKSLIAQGKVKVNWKEINQPSYELGVGDIVSMRGFGRLKIVSLEGKTKKDKVKVRAARQK